MDVWYKGDLRMSDKRLPVLFGVHNHQPHGNFHHVIEEITEACYLPFLKALSQEPAIKFSIHVSGPLLLWWEVNRVEILELLTRMIADGQVEVLTGGFYEPILAAISRADRREQIQRLTSYLEDRLGCSPKGFWLSERVWEPLIVEDLIEAGVEYVLVDDRHFLVSGFSKQDLHGYFLTESGGRSLKVFPIDETLRYLIPFRPVVELEGYLRSIAGYGSMAVYMDDGEKFGAWPGTREWVYERGWLRDFMERALEWSEDFVEWVTFSQAIEKIPGNGICYLPSSSYEEMEKWTLPAEKVLRFEELVRGLGPQARDVYRPFLRGGHWRNFFVKYPESNLMHRRSLEVSRMTLAASPVDSVARDLVLASQCHDPYWHGIFGGLYLPHLRHATWQGILQAEARMRRSEELSISLRDLDCDGKDEVWVTSSELSLVIDPAYGGQVRELSFFNTAHNYCNSLTRRHEAYHDLLRETVQRGGFYPGEGETGSGEGIPSIHNMERLPDGSLLDCLIYDWYQRNSFIDHLFDPAAILEDFQRCDFKEWGDFANQPFEVQIKGHSVTCSRSGGVYQLWAGKKSVDITKVYIFDEKGREFRVLYTIRNSGAETVDCRFGVEWNLFPPFLVAGEGGIWIREDEQARSLFEVDESELLRQPLDILWEKDGREVWLKEEGHGGGLSIDVGPGACFWGFPVETVSQSEKGYEKIIQAIAVMAHWPLTIGPGEKWGREIVVRMLEG